MSSSSVRVATIEEMATVRRVSRAGFLAPPIADDAPNTAWDDLEPDRRFVCVEANEIVGTGASRALTITLPGGAAVAAAGVTDVAVLPTHRRRGHLSRLMHAIRRDALDRGELTAVLTASDTRLYRRFGYGVSSWRDEFEVTRSALVLRSAADPTVTLTLHDVDGPMPSALKRALATVFAAEQHRRPGVIGRPAVWWDSEWPSPAWIPGPASRVVVAHRGPDPVGYAGHRSRIDHVEIEEFVALDVGVEDALWRFFAGLELTERFVVPRVPIDTLLPGLVTDLRAVRRLSRRDDVWLCLLDVPAVLAARTYAADGALVIELHEENGAANGRYHLAVEDGKGVCTSTEFPPDVVVAAPDFASMITGAQRAYALSALGRLAADPTTVRALDRMFDVDMAPWGITQF